MEEIPYFMLFGYLFICAAIGVFWMCAWCEALNWWQARRGDSEMSPWARVARTGAFLSFPLVVIGFLLTVLHLGQISRFYLIIMKPFSSWLSREAWAAGAFAGFSLLYLLMWALKKGSSFARLVVVVIGGIVGLFALFAMSMIYAVVEAFPSWNTTLHFLLNLGYSFALGVFIVGTLVAYQRWDTVRPGNRMVPFLAGGVVSLGLIGFAYVAYQAHLAILPDIPGLRIPDTFTLQVLRMVVGVILPLALVVFAWFKLKDRESLVKPVMTLSLVLVVVGCVVAWIVHFANAVAAPVAF